MCSFLNARFSMLEKLSAKDVKTVLYNTINSSKRAEFFFLISNLKHFRKEFEK